MANRKIYIDRKGLSAKEISQGKDFARLLTEYKKITIPFYAKTPFILSAVATTIAITGSFIYITYFTKNNADKKEHSSIINQLVNKTADTSAVIKKNAEFLKSDNEKNNIHTSYPYSDASHIYTTSSTAELHEKKQDKNKYEPTNGIVNNYKNGHSMPVENSKSDMEKTATTGSSVRAAKAVRKVKENPAEYGKNQHMIASTPNVKNKKPSHENNNMIKSARIYKNKNNQPLDNSNSQKDKRAQNIFASQEKKNAMANDYKNSNAGTSETKNNVIKNQSENYILQEKETKMENDKSAIISSTINAFKNNPVISKDSVKNTDTTQDETNKNDFERSFDKRRIVVLGGIGIGIYGTLSTDINGATKKDGAGSAIYSLAGEYGVAKWIGLGAKFSLDNYFVKPDSITGTIPHAYSLNSSGFVNFHFVRSKRFDLFAGVSAGYSRFIIKFHDINNTAVMGNGSLFSLYVVPRFYFGKRLGMFANIALAGFNYSSLAIKNNLTSVFLNNKFAGNGFNIGIGAQMKF